MPELPKVETIKRMLEPQIKELLTQRGMDALKAELKKDIVCGDGIGYPYGWWDVPAYLPKLCAKYMTPAELERWAEGRGDTWNLTSPDIQQARATAQKSRKIKKDRGDTR